MTMKIERVFVTPEIAEAMLKKNTGNFRKVEKNRVSQYAGDMLRGAWDDNGETIKFNGTALIDGQHRLAAVLKSGVSVWMLVVSGVEASALNIDRGKPRTLGQWLSHGGILNANKVAAVARASIEYESGQWLMGSAGARKAQVTDRLLADFIDKNRERLDSAVRLAARAKAQVKCSVLAVVYMYGCEGPACETDSAVWFNERLLHGDMLGDMSAILHLRNKMGKKNVTYSTELVRRMATFTWNKTVLDEPCTSRQFQSMISAQKPSEMMSEISTIAKGTK